MAIDKVKEYFKAYGMEDRILEFPVSSATVELAAEAVGCEPCRIAKTLSFMANDFPILIVAAVVSQNKVPVSCTKTANYYISSIMMSLCTCL